MQFNNPYAFYEPYGKPIKYNDIHQIGYFDNKRSSALLYRLRVQLYADRKHQKRRPCCIVGPAIKCQI